MSDWSSEDFLIVMVILLVVGSFCACGVIHELKKPVDCVQEKRRST